jgi:DsbC/DsbD-like thiol-disulfide interchange protein
MQRARRWDWNMRNLLILLALAMAIWGGMIARPAWAIAAQVPKDLVKAELLADVSAVKPGEEFTLGVLLKIKPNWHVYWKYPGDAGLATTVKWKLPDAGAGAGGDAAAQPELRFPLPVRFDQPGDVVGYGYKHEVLLTARVKAPHGAAGETKQFAADVSWLVCETICIPGKAKLSLSIPLADKTTPANQELFGKWLAQLPQPAASAAIKQIEIQQVGDRQFQAKVASPDQKITDVQWFPLPPKGVGVEDAQTKSHGNESVFLFTLVPLPKDVLKMQFLVTYADPSGKRQGVEFSENLPTPLSK